MSTDDERHIGFLISDVARLLRTAFDRRVRRLGLTRSQWLVMNRLYRRPGATQSELAEMLEVEKATAGRMVDRMEKKGWVVRRPDASDRRVNRLHLSAEADLIQLQLAQIADRTVDDALALLSAPEREQFSESMRRVKSRLQAMLEPLTAEPGAGDPGAAEPGTAQPEIAEPVAAPGKSADSGVPVEELVQ